MAILFEDTHPEIEARLVEAWRSMTPSEKLSQAFAMRQTMMAMAMAGLRLRHPDESEARLRRRLAAILVGEDLANRAYGPLEASDESEPH